MRTVLLKFSGPLQSWGTNSHFITRYTDSHPSKSGVIGMIAAGLGYSREEDEDLERLNSLAFAVRIDQIGGIAKDYQVARIIDKNGETVPRGGYQGYRYYLEDAVFTVALGSDDPELIEDVVDAFEFQYYPIYLGRKGCPLNPDVLLDVLDTDPVTALKEYPWQAREWYRKKNRGKLQIFADGPLLDTRNVQVRRDSVITFSLKKGRRYTLRKEAWIFVDAMEETAEEEHDAFGAIGEN